MYDIIPLILILFSLVAIIIIVVRKFSVLASLDLDTIQREREARFKEVIISNKLKRSFFKYYSKLPKLTKPVMKASGDLFKLTHDKLMEFKENYNKEKADKSEDAENDIIEKMMTDADEFIRNDELEKAEKKYIDIIGIDSKNIAAFKGLGDLYIDKKEFVEARQTLNHVLRLFDMDLEGTEMSENTNHQMAGIYFDLSLVEKMSEDLSTAIENINKALDLEPNNPRYLDTKLELCIINRDKNRAWRTYDKLKEADPDNQKLGELKEKLEAIE